MNFPTSRPYDNPPPGIYCGPVMLEMDGNVPIIEIAAGYGWNNAEAQAVLLTGGDDEDNVNRLAIAATEYLNSLETRPGLRWGPDSAEESFGLFDLFEPSTQEVHAKSK